MLKTENKDIQSFRLKFLYQDIWAPSTAASNLHLRYISYCLFFSGDNRETSMSIAHWL